MFHSFFVDYDALRALDSDNAPAAPSMSEEEINALPVHKYKVQSYHTAPSGPQRLVRRTCQVVELLLIRTSCFNVVSVNMVDFLSLGCCVF